MNSSFSDRWSFSYLNLTRGFLSKSHVQTAHEFHDLNMDFVVWTRLPDHFTMASRSYVCRYLCKNVSFWIVKAQMTDLLVNSSLWSVITTAEMLCFLRNDWTEAGGKACDWLILSMAVPRDWPIVFRRFISLSTCKENKMLYLSLNHSKDNGFTLTLDLCFKELTQWHMFLTPKHTSPDSSVGRVSAPGNGRSRVRSRAATYQSRKKWY